MSKHASAQQFIEIDQIRKGIIILKNKWLRGILTVSSLNFSLKSDEEQKATLYQFQNFLNSLDFSCQILIQSRKLNITGYLDKLKEIEKGEQNELLKIQISEYQKFIKEYLETGTVIKKNFFIIIPFSIQEGLGIKETKKMFKTVKAPKLSEEEFQRGKSQLQQRMEFVILGLRRCGLQSVPLTTPEIIELFWATHHPEETEFGYYPGIPPELEM